MLVSSIARFQAINTMNNTMFQAMQASNNIMRLANNAHSFGGDNDLSFLHELDKRFALDMATNGLLYKLAYYQEKMLAKLQAQEIKNSSIDYKA